MQTRPLTGVALAGSLVFAAGALVAAAFWPALRRWAPAETPRQGCAHCGEAPTFRFDAALSPATNRGRHTIITLLEPKPVWSDRDVDLVAAMMPMGFDGPAADPSARSGPGREAVMLHAWALGAVKKRLVKRDSVEPSARTRLVGLVIDRLAHPIVGVRYGACAAAIEGGLMTDPAVAARITALVDDRDRRVASLARTARNRGRPGDATARGARDDPH